MKTDIERYERYNWKDIIYERYNWKIKNKIDNSST